LAINGGLLAFQQGWLDPLLPSSHEPSRLAQQLHADQLTLVPLAENKPAASVPVSAPPAAEPEPVATATPAVAACTEIGNFDTAEAQRFESRLASMSLGARLTRRTIPDNARYIVYIPPLASKEVADKKAAELRGLGVEDFFVIQDNSALQSGISLGVFKSEEAARAHLAALNKKGVRSAKISAHGTNGNKMAFQLRGIDAATKGSIDKVREGFPRQQWRECA
jgi:hypothetical protein